MEMEMEKLYNKSGLLFDRSNLLFNIFVFFFFFFENSKKVGILINV
jgi:hypothetical protein